MDALKEFVKPASSPAGMFINGVFRRAFATRCDTKKVLPQLQAGA